MRTAPGRGRDTDKSKFSRALLYFSCSCLTLPRLLSQDAEERPHEHGRGTKSGPVRGEELVAMSDLQGRVKGGGQPGGRRTKETSGQAERIQWEYGHSSAAMGCAPAGGGGQAGGSFL